MKSKIVITLSFFLASFSVYTQEVNLNIDKYLWQEDFQFLKTKVEKTVPTYQIPNIKKAFDEIYDACQISDMSNRKEEIVLSLQQLLNTLNDEGCNVPLFQKGIELEILPIKTYWFNDGLFVLDASDENNDIVGQQIVKINGTDIEDVFNKLKSFLNADNKYYKKHLFQAYGFMPSFLKKVGFGQSNDEVTLQFASGITKKVKSSSINDYVKLSRGLPNDEVFSLTKSDHKGDNYWLEMIPNSKTLFVQMQQISNNDNGSSFSSFINQVKALIQNKKADKLILDLRYGGGGNGFKLKSFTDLLRDSNSINQKGNLFVLTSKATRGTLLELASILKLNTKAILVGEPTAEGVNTVGDIKYITLPNSGIKMSLTHTFWPTSWKNDTRKFLLPDKQVVFNYSDITQEKDPWLKAVSNYKVEESDIQFPSDFIKKIVGTYKIEGRKVTIENKNGGLFLNMNRKMKSFFEIQTELYFQSDGLLSTDIDGVNIVYKQNSSNEIELEILKWKDLSLKIE